jgi:hypothetical protein
MRNMEDIFEFEIEKSVLNEGTYLCSELSPHDQIFREDSGAHDR